MADDWIDVSALGEYYEVQFSPSADQYRYRERYLPTTKSDPFSGMERCVVTEQWIMGLPPSRKLPRCASAT